MKGLPHRDSPALGSLAVFGSPGFCSIGGRPHSRVLLVYLDCFFGKTRVFLSCVEGCRSEELPSAQLSGLADM